MYKLNNEKCSANICGMNVASSRFWEMWVVVSIAIVKSVMTAHYTFLHIFIIITLSCVKILNIEHACKCKYILSSECLKFSPVNSFSIRFCLWATMNDDLTRVLPHVWFSNYVISEGMRLKWIYINFTCELVNKHACVQIKSKTLADLVSHTPTQKTHFTHTHKHSC